MLAFQLLNGLTFAALLFVVASGFTLIFGVLRIVNLAHGALYLLGGYIGFAVARLPAVSLWSESAPWLRSLSLDCCSIRAFYALFAGTNCGRSCLH